MLGNEGINLILGWQGNSEEVSWKIAEGGQLTPKQKADRGIHQTDAGYFGQGFLLPPPPILSHLSRDLFQMSPLSVCFPLMVFSALTVRVRSLFFSISKLWCAIYRSSYLSPVIMDFNGKSLPSH